MFMTKHNAKQDIKSAPIFNGLSDNEKDDMLNAGKVRSLNKGEFLFLHGEQITHFYIICSGVIQIFRNNSDGTEKTLHLLTAQNTICESEICESCTAHQFHAMAVQDAIIIAFPKKWLRESIGKYADFSFNILSIISHRIQMMELEAEHLAIMSVTQMVACFLEKLCLNYKFNPSGFKLPYSKKLIASRLGIEVETLSRTLLKLKDYGIIVTGSMVTINNFCKLEQQVCAHCSVKQDFPIYQNLQKKC